MRKRLSRSADLEFGSHSRRATRVARYACTRVKLILARDKFKRKPVVKARHSLKWARKNNLTEMRRRKRVKWIWLLASSIWLVQLFNFTLALLLITNCLSGSPGCSCSWRSGKFVSDCSSQSLKQVPKVSSIPN